MGRGKRIGLDLFRPFLNRWSHNYKILPLNVCFHKQDIVPNMFAIPHGKNRLWTFCWNYVQRLQKNYPLQGKDMLTWHTIIRTWHLSHKYYAHLRVWKIFLGFSFSWVGLHPSKQVRMFEWEWKSNLNNRFSFMSFPEIYIK